jgi:hypothetical protein
LYLEKKEWDLLKKIVFKIPNLFLPPLEGSDPSEEAVSFFFVWLLRFGKKDTSGKPDHDLRSGHAQIVILVI